MSIETGLILAGFAVIQAVILVTAVILVRSWTNKRVDEIKSNVSAFFMPKSDGPSDFAAIVGTIGDDLSGRIVSHAKSTFMGMQSGAVRQEKALTSALTQDVIAMESPMIAALIQSFPALRKKLDKNPELAQLLPGILEKFTKGGIGTTASGGSNGNGSHSAVKFKF